VRVNRVEIDGRIASHQGLRHTPAGMPSFQLQFLHASMQYEAGRERKVECEIEALAFGEVAANLARQSPESNLTLIGFLERKGMRSSIPILHVTEFKIIKE